jgi:hypothetical protein
MIEKIEIIEDVQKLILSFSKEKLTTEEEVICMHIWKKLTRKRTLDITRTRSDIWAGLVLIRKKSLEMATLKLVSAIIENPYIAPMLLKEPLPESDWWHSSSLAEPQYAEEYVREYQSWWQKEECALRFLRAIWGHGEVQRTLRDFIAMRRYLKKSGDGEPGYVRKGLIGEKIMKVAEKIYAGFTRDDSGQMRLV